MDRILCAAEGAASADAAEAPSARVELPPLNAASYNWLIHGKKTQRLFAMPFDAENVITLPRQARDRHRESTQKKGRVSAGYANASPAPLPTNAAGVLQRIESSPWPEVQPDVVSYTSVIDAYAKAANYDAVCTLAKPSSRFIQGLQVLPLSALPLPLRGAWLGASLDCSLSRMRCRRQTVHVFFCDAIYI
jgi:hypothetical protein